VCGRLNAHKAEHKNTNATVWFICLQI